MRDLLCLPITAESQIPEIRSLAVAMARTIGFSDPELDRVALIVTEASKNLVKHTPSGGEILVRSLQYERVGGVEILALDRGPGISDVEQALRHGYRTTGNPWVGLGAIRRIASLFDLYTGHGVGTALLARLWSGALPAKATLRCLTIGAISIARSGEEVCGDVWAVEQRAVRGMILLADGAGDRPGAAEAAAQAIETFRANPGLTPKETVALIHTDLQGKSGAAVAAIEIDTAHQTARSVSIGNISGKILTPESSYRLLTQEGIVGYEIGDIEESGYPWSRDSLLIVHSDGLNPNWSLDRYPGLAQHHPSLIAGVLFRDFGRRGEDITVVVAKSAMGG